MPKSWNLKDSWFIITLYLVDGLFSNAKVLVRKFLDGYRKELLRDMGYFRSCSGQPINQLLFLFSGQLAALNRYVRHRNRFCYQLVWSYNLIMTFAYYSPKYGNRIDCRYIVDAQYLHLMRVLPCVSIRAQSYLKNDIIAVLLCQYHHYKIQSCLLILTSYFYEHSFSSILKYILKQPGRLIR